MYIDLLPTLEQLAISGYVVLFLLIIWVEFILLVVCSDTSELKMQEDESQLEAALLRVIIHRQSPSLLVFYWTASRSVCIGLLCY
jgi:hypothetical protein